METKSEIRKRILEIRKGLTDEEAASKSEAIVQRSSRLLSTGRRTISCFMQITAGR